MKLIDCNGKHVGNVFYNDGTNMLVGDFVKTDKVYVVCRRIWESSVGEITSLIVREVDVNDIEK